MPSEGLTPPVPHLLFVSLVIVVALASITAADATNETLFAACSGQVLRVMDLNGDGDALDANEVVLFASGLPQNITAIACTADRLFVADGSNVGIIVLVDTNHDGDAMDSGEVSTFADLSPWLNDNPPIGLVIDADGNIYTVDTAGQQLLRLADLNNDGDAFDIGEVFPVATGINDAPALALRPDSSILVVMDNAAVPVRLLVDHNADGDFLDYAENIGYGASFGPGIAIANIDESSSLLVRAADSQILKLIDLNGDDDVMDVGEVISYAQPAASIKAITHSPTSGHFVAAGVSNGTIHRVIDLNGDGDAFDAGESHVYASGLPVIRGLAIRTGGCIPGDINADGVLDSDDVGAFVEVLLGIVPPPEVCRADLNSDGRIDGEDIAPFVQRMLE